MSLVDQLPPATPGRTNTPVPVRMSRGEFLDFFAAEWAPGQHVAFLGPTQRGKTTLSHQMLAQVISPDLPVFMCALKPPGRDPVMAKAAERLNLREISEFTEKRNLQDRLKGRCGFVVRPTHDMLNHRATKENLQRVVHETLTRCYARKKAVILDLDETHVIQNDLGLKDDVEAPLMRGAPIVSEWNIVQRGAHISYHVYGASEWVIIFYDPVVMNQRRYGDIGGVDPRMVVDITSRLPTKRGDDGKATISEALCIRRTGPELIIIATD